jgi:hypothetical protein
MALLLAGIARPLQAQNADTGRVATPAPGGFLGEASCSSSGCHGGAGEKHDQTIRWAKFDIHTRSAATLGLARSARIADVLKLGDPAVSPRCTVCHEPFQTLATTPALVKSLDPASGVSCENCHGPAQNWLLTHTRKDLTHQDRVVCGVRDLSNLYVRANTCVACHQNVDADLLQAGHPELIFELDGQSVTEPKHWREETNWSGAQTWLVGQAVALREMSWQLTRENPATENAINRQAALAWLLQGAGKINSALPIPPINPEEKAKTLSVVQQAGEVQKWADEFARAASSMSWSAAETRKCLDLLAATAPGFRDSAAPTALQARRAERLVLALDRLAARLDDEATAKHLDAPLDQLFKDSQSVPDFNPPRFAGHLEEFQKALAVRAP